MKALVYNGPRDVSVQEVDDPSISAPTDAIIKVTSAAICGSDLHMYEGRTGMPGGNVLGHEIMGVIEEVGEAVLQLKTGDRVVLPFNIACGTCFNCARGFTNACLYANPHGIGAGFGYAGLGPYQGGQAQKVLVPFADFNALKLPGQPNDEHEDDFLMLADIYPTAWHANVLAQVGIGYSVAVYGAGPVGLLSVMSAKLRGAADIFCVDHHDDRLAKARELGATTIDFTKDEPKTVIAEHSQKVHTAAARPGEDKLKGVLSGIDAVGYQALRQNNPKSERASQVIEELTEIVEPTGAIGLIGVYTADDPGAPNEDAKHGTYPIPIGPLWSKNLTVGTGQCPVKRYNEFLRETIISGRARPGTIVTHHVSLNEAPEYYERFDKREEGVIKIVLQPNG